MVALYIKKKNTFSFSQVGRVSTDRITQLLLKDLHLKDCVQSLNTGRFSVTIETLEKVENSVCWTLNDFIKVSLIRRERHKVLVFVLT